MLTINCLEIDSNSSNVSMPSKLKKPKFERFIKDMQKPQQDHLVYSLKNNNDHMCNIKQACITSMKKKIKKSLEITFL